MPLKPPLRIFLALAGISLFAFLIWRVGPGELLEGIRNIGWGFVPVFLLGGAAHLIKTRAWQFTLREEHRVLPFRRMFAIRLAGEGVSQVTFAGQVVGETTRALLMRPSVPMVAGISSVVLDRTMFTLTAMLFSVAGVLFSVVAFPLPGDIQRYAVWALVPISGVMALAVLAVRFRWAFISGPMKLAARFGILKRWMTSRVDSARGIEDLIYAFYSSAKKSFWASFCLNFAGHMVAMLEVFLILTLMGLEIPVASAFIIEALTKLINLGGALIPGNLGASEGGNMLILRGLGYAASDGFALAVARRIRGLAWTAVGLSLLYTSSLKDHRVPSPRDERGDETVR